jgi:hypothetical protein
MDDLTKRAAPIEAPDAPEEKTVSSQLTALMPGTRTGWVELISSLLLAIATVATAWSGYQAASWGGVAATNYHEANARQAESIRASTRGGQAVQVDIVIFSNWINAYAAGDERLADFYRERFRPEFLPAFDAWLATDPQNNPDAPATPFDMPEYRLSEFVLADQLEAESEAEFESAAEANELSDDYVLNTVILASVLFFAGLANRFNYPLSRTIVVLAALFMLAVGLYDLATYPIQ